MREDLLLSYYYCSCAHCLPFLFQIQLPYYPILDWDRDGMGWDRKYRLTLTEKWSKMKLMQCHTLWNWCCSGPTTDRFPYRPPHNIEILWPITWYYVSLYGSKMKMMLRMLILSKCSNVPLYITYSQAKLYYLLIAYYSGVKWTEPRGVNMRRVNYMYLCISFWLSASRFFYLKKNFLVV